MDNPKARLRRERCATRPPSLLEHHRLQIDHCMRLALDRLPPEEATSIEIMWLAQQLGQCKAKAA
jgi:hypothetical protein